MLFDIEICNLIYEYKSKERQAVNYLANNMIERYIDCLDEMAKLEKEINARWIKLTIGRICKN